MRSTLREHRCGVCGATKRVIECPRCLAWSLEEQSRGERDDKPQNTACDGGAP